MSRSWRHPRLGTRFLEWLVARRTGNLLLLVLFLLLAGTVGYVLIEEMSWVDAAYQAMLTLSTVGYQDLTETQLGRVFTIVFMALGVGVFIVMLSSLAAFLVEGRLREVIGRRRMEGDIAELRQHIVLCGYGRFGQMTAAELARRDVPFAIVESDPEKVSLAEERSFLALHADATEEESLERMGLQHARGLISTLGTDAENVYVALTAKQLYPEVVVVTVARDPHAESKLLAAGADHVISPYTIGSVDLTRRILQPHVSRFLDSARGVQVRIEEVAVRAGSPLVHVALRDTELRERFGVTVVAVVKTREDDVRYNPDPTMVLEAGDVLVAVGTPEGLERVADACAHPRAP